ncbi:hypothetical protein [Mucilaginibacter glaciei]|uniref:Uncharacterized protein n=1 Tax=Mucilaginibacter glaciei TaxID=2772109 RepID=A0A926NRE2_9SPHI|nr:hypothetical protein [Mucilaginibacter glaciei]MBD1394636.1 hypothetical protein [Mucilaginibacter glaciei]
MKRARAVLFREGTQNLDISDESKAVATKTLVTLILANLFCALLLYIIYLVF